MEHISIGIYALIIATAVGVSILAKFRPQTIAPFSNVMNHVLSNKTNRFALTFFWWWIGWHFVGSPWPVA
ncbi:unannotated protein [freshwater metagenome]|uniref:Unannotated protein n=1 Tax=freshwater metagenome TaxID=449393 RepID=A0A6J7IVF6_9ZZZZ|nr:hypothetical protein [Actinomycetota bacterium]